MPLDRTAYILSTALWRFSLQALHLTTTADIAQQAGVSVGTLFRTFPTKEDLLDNVYAYAMTQLQQPLLAGPGSPQRGEYLTKLLQRWWHLPAQVALNQPHVFAFWRLYRTYALTRALRARAGAAGTGARAQHLVPHQTPAHRPDGRGAHRAVDGGPGRSAD